MPTDTHIIDLSKPEDFPAPTAPTALVAITKGGVEKAREILQKLPEADLYYPEKFAHGDEAALGIRLYQGGVKELLPVAFGAYRSIIALVSLGALIRLAAPHLKDKKSDPAVVVLDEKAEFAIAALSGHLGGGNQLARTVASAIGATPVITTSSDVQGKLAADLLGREFGWRLELNQNMTEVSAAIVNDEPVAIIQESGETNWNDTGKELDKSIVISSELSKDLPKTKVMITHRLLAPGELTQLDHGILYRPRVIALGIGCNRNTPATEIAEVVDSTLAELSISPLSIRGMASIDLKKDEVGLLEFCKERGYQLKFYTPQELNSVEISDPSDTVFKYTGAWGVSEPAARLLSKGGELLLVKKKSGNVTISVGLTEF